MLFPSDHGFRSDPQPRRVHSNDVFRRRCALGISEWRTLRRHRDAGYWECSMVRWISDVPDFRHSMIGGIQIVAETKILACMRDEDDAQWPIETAAKVCPVFRHITGAA